MKRSTISLSAENFGRVAIDIGRVAENQAVQVRVDLSKFLLQEPKATASLAVESPSGERYPAITRMEGKALIWDVAAADVASAGMGKVQLNVLGPNGEVLKSAVAATRIGGSIVGDGQAPDPVQNWVDDAANKLGSAVQAGKEAEKAASKANAAAEAANTAAKNAQTVADAVQEKLDNGDFVGPAGKPGSDASVTTENIQSALGYIPIKDVRLNGESLVQDSAATIPLAGYNRLGAVQLDPAGFAAASIEGKLSLVPPTDAQISTHTHTQRPITPSCMDYAVKSAMCDGKGAAWTEAEQKAARERMGIDKPYELIEEFDLSEASTFERTEEPDGTPFSFIDIITQIIVPKNTSLTTGSFFAQAKNIAGNFINVGRGYMSGKSSDDNRMGYMQRTRIRHGYWESAWGDWEKNLSVLNFNSADVYQYWLKYKESEYKAINKIYETTVLPAGTHIRIFGVRA